MIIVTLFNNTVSTVEYMYHVSSNETGR